MQLTFEPCKNTYNLVNQPEQIDQSDSFLPTKVLDYETVFYFKSWLDKWE